MVKMRRMERNGETDLRYLLKQVSRQWGLHLDVRTKGEWVKDNSEVFIRMINDMLLLLERE